MNEIATIVVACGARSPADDADDVRLPGSISGAALGGILLGLLQSLGPALILTGYDIPSPFQLKDAFTFFVLVLVLIFRPGGLLGTGEAEKV